jgi:hypothetical protein
MVKSKLLFVGLLFFLVSCAQKPVSSVQVNQKLNSENSSLAEVVEPEIASFKLSEDQANTEGDEELDHIPTEVNPKVDMWINYFSGYCEKTAFQKIYFTSHLLNQVLIQLQSATPQQWATGSLFAAPEKDMV